MPEFEATGVIYCEHCDCSTSLHRYAFDSCARNTKVVFPMVRPRMEQYGDLAGQRIDACQVRALAQIALVTRQGEILRLVGAAVFARQDVLDMVG